MLLDYEKYQVDELNFWKALTAELDLQIIVYVIAVGYQKALPLCHSNDIIKLYDIK